MHFTHYHCETKKIDHEPYIVRAKENPKLSYGGPSLGPFKNRTLAFPQNSLSLIKLTVFLPLDACLCVSVFYLSSS